MTLLIILFALFLAGAYGLRLRFRSALAESTAIREQMDRHADEVMTTVCAHPDTCDEEMATFELVLLDGVWNRIVERQQRFFAWRRRWLWRWV